MTIGILGGGQLARMLALAGYPLGQQFIVLDPSPDAGATGLAKHLQGDYDDPALLAQMAEEADVVTFEFENVPADTATFLSAHTRVCPSANALAVAQDRLAEKRFFHELEIPTAPFAPVDSFEDLRNGVNEVGRPAILKSRRMGYDGKGQVLLQESDPLSPAWASMQGAASIVEGFVPFDREVSIIAARRPGGDTVFYPLSENRHSGGILRVSECRPADPMSRLARDYVDRLLQALDYVGVIALELFEVGGRLLANEFAPRVHNSGHWTIEGAETSQFENHLRAILDLPLGSTAARGHAGMVNFIGGLPPTDAVLAIEQSHLHLYDKAPRKHRKVGHASVRADDPERFSQAMTALTELARVHDDS